MKLPHLPLIGGALFIDNSGWMESIGTCHRYLQYKSLNLRISCGEKPALNFGSAIHLASEYRYNRYASRAVDELQYYEDIGKILTSHFELHPPAGDDWRNLNWAMSLMRKYNARYEVEEFSLLKYDDPIKCPYCEGEGFNLFVKHDLIEEPTEKICLWCQGTGLRTLMVEMSFALPLYTWKGVLDDGSNARDSKYETEIPIIYSGKIDLPLSIDGNLYVMDHKTTSMLGDWFWTEQRMSSQQRGYCWAFQTLTSMPVHGYIVNGIRTKEPPQYVTKGTTHKGKSRSPTEWWKESFNRERFILKPGELDEWKANTIDLVEEFFWHYQRDYMPMKTKWCNSYGRCPYYDVCRLPADERDFMLASGEFTDNTWSPLKQPTQSAQ